MADDVAASLRAFTKETDRLNDSLEKAVSLFQQLAGKGAAGPFGGAGSLGQGSSKVMNATHLGKISTNGVMGPSMPMAAGSLMNQSLQMSKLSAGLRIGGNIMSTSMGMMPDVGAVMTRAGGMFSATLRAGGGMSRRQVGQGTFSLLSGGLTSEGSDAEVAQILTGMGNQVSFDPNSAYARNVRGVRNAAMYLGMDNASAAAAIGGMTTGTTSSAMLRNYGIFTADPRTGKTFTQGQIMSQLAQRMTAGRRQASEGETLESLKRGSLGANIRGLVSSGAMSEDQAAIYSQFMIERSKGNYLDLEDQDAMDAMMKKAKEEGNENPFLAGYQMNSSATRQYDKSEDAYIGGLKAAAGALEGLNDAAGALAGTFGGLKSGLEGVLGSTAGGALSGGIGGIAGGIASSMAINSFAKANGFVPPTFFGGAKNLGQGLVSGGKNLLNSPMVKSGLRGLGIAGGVIGLGMSATSAYDKGQTGEEMNAGDFGGAALSGAMTGASIGAGFGVPGMLIGGGIGALAGLLTAGVANSAGAGSTGGGETPSQNNPSGKNIGSNGGGGGFSLIHPVSGPKGAVFGQKGPNWDPVVGHRGLDYKVGTGTAVKAAASGVIHTVKHDSNGALGKKVIIQHGNGYVTEYCHLSQAGTGGLQAGDRVAQGQKIALSGNSGSNTTGQHLHFTVRTGPGGKYLNPELFLPGGGGGASTTPESSGTTSSGASTNPAASVGTSSTDSSGNSSPLLTTGVSGLTVSEGASSGSEESLLQTGISGLIAPGTSEGAKVEPYKGTGQGGEGYAPASLNVGTSTMDSAVDATSLISGRKKSDSRYNVTINVNVASASDSEAKRFAQIVKRELENDKIIKNMGRR